MSSAGGGGSEARKAGVRVVAHPAVAAGFELAGMTVLQADDRDAARASALAAASEPRVGVILIQEDLAGDVLELEARVREAGGAALVPFPGPTWAERPEAAREYVARILRRAIGYRVRL